MAENKSDFIKDPVKLKEHAEKLQKEMYEFYKIDPKTNRIVIKEDYTHKPVIEFWDMPMGKVNEMITKGEWKYGTYYLDGDPKEGFYKMENGQYVFVHVTYNVSTLSQANYVNAFELAHPIEALNPQLRGHVYPNSDSIEIAYPIVDNLEMPSPWKFDRETSCVVNSMTGYAIEVKVTNESNRDMTAPDRNDAYKEGSGILNTSTRESVAKLRNERDSENVEDEIREQSDQIEISIEDLSPRQMFDTYQRYELTKVGGKYLLQNREKDRTEDVMNLTTKEDSQKMKFAYLNNLWLDACSAYNRGAELSRDQKYMDSTNLAILGVVMSTLKSGQPISEIFLAISNDQRIPDKQTAVMIAYTFLQLLNQRAGLNIELNASMDEYMAAMSSIENNSSTIDDNEPVMEKKLQ